MVAQTAVQNSPEIGLLGHSCRALSLGEDTNLAVSAKPEFCMHLQTGWKGVLRNADYCASMRTYCVLCGQWASVGGIKPHVRLMHPDARLHKAEAVARCTGLGLRVESPCAYCCLAIKDPKTHIRRCSVLFQASPCALVIAQEHDSSSCRPSGHDGTARDAGSHGLCEEQPVRASSAGYRDGSGGAGATSSGWRMEMASGESGRSRISMARALEAGPPGLVHGGGEGEGPGVDSRHPDAAAPHGDGQVGNSPRGGVVEAPDTTFCVYPAEVWNQQCEEGKVTTPLRIVLLMLIFKELGDHITKLLADETRREQAKQYGWLEWGLQDADPSWKFVQWNPAQQRQAQTVSKSAQ